jgi:hypothetical protein
MNRMFFPLRTSVEFFSDPTSPDAAARAKQAAVLFDELVFEMSVYDVLVTDAGAFGVQRYPNQLTDDDFAQVRRVAEPGSMSRLILEEDRTEGDGRASGWAVFDAPLHVNYVAEWYSVLRDLERCGSGDLPSWVHVVDRRRYLSSEELRRALRRLDFRCYSNKQLMPGVHRWLRSWTYKAFNHDALFAGAMAASFNVTTHFNPMVAHHKLDPVRSGDNALSVVCPHVGALPWDAVLAFREHSGAQEARSLLRAIDEKAARGEPTEADEQQRIGQAVTTLLLQVAKDRGTKVAGEVVKATVGFFPLGPLGPIVGAVAGVGPAADRAWRERRSWTAALVTLRDDLQ